MGGCGVRRSTAAIAIAIRIRICGSGWRICRRRWAVAASGGAAIAVLDERLPNSEWPKRLGGFRRLLDRNK